LSTALARRGDVKNGSVKENGTAVAYLAVLMGPSVSAPRAKVVLGLDGLEVGVWGVREDVRGDDSESDRCDSDEGSEKEERDYVEKEDDAVDAVSSDEEDRSPPQSDDDDGASSSTTSSRSSSPPPQVSHAQIEQVLRNAERLLARTLASHEGGDGFWMADELGRVLSPLGLIFLLLTAACARQLQRRRIFFFAHRADFDIPIGRLD
jgi:hypothetical protein